MLRSELCNAYYCSGLQAAMKAAQDGAAGLAIVTRAGAERRVRRDASA
jgi:hypothetical protein